MFVEIQYPTEKQMMGVVDTIGKKVNCRFSTRHTGELYKHVSIFIVVVVVVVVNRQLLTLLILLYRCERGLKQTVQTWPVRFVHHSMHVLGQIERTSRSVRKLLMSCSQTMAPVSTRLHHLSSSRTRILHSSEPSSAT
jgi:hypothetical protein